MESDDPWDWSVDRVVQELCTDQRSWPAWSKTQRLPDPIKFQNFLRELEVDGSLLLTGLYDSGELRACCNLRESTTVRHMISFFRRKSASYRNFVPAFGDLSHIEYTPTQSNGDSSRNPHGSFARIATSHASTMTANGVDYDAAAYHDARVSISGDVDALETELGKVQDGKRRKVVEAANQTEVEYLPSPVADIFTSPEVRPESLGPVENMIDGQVQEVSSPSRKRKRLAPTLITPYVTSSLKTPLPSAADSVVLHDPHSIEPGVIYKGDDGRKRLIPIPSDGVSKEWLDQCQVHQDNLDLDLQVSSPGSSQHKDDSNIHGPRSSNQSKATTDASKASETGYLGRSNYTIDEVFYDQIPIGSGMGGVEEAEELKFTKRHIPAAGRRLYINSLMKHYFRSSRRTITRGGKTFSIQQPYSKLLMPIHQSPSFTLFSSTQRGVITTREALSRWPEIENGPTKKFPVNDDERKALFDLPDICAIGGPSSYDNWDASLLEKYRFIDGGDAVLPLYGDSDDENDYDAETWREIEAEHGEQEQPVQMSKKPALSLQAVNAAIDEGVAQLVSKWRQNKLPKRDGWKLWHKCQKQNTKRLHIRNARRTLLRINEENIPKLRKAITDEHWTSQSQVRKITANMEQTVFNREDLLWQVSILEKKLPPPRMENHELRVSRSKSPKHSIEAGGISDDDESLHSESDSDSMDDLGNFIVSDDSQEDSDIVHANVDEDEVLSGNDLDHNSDEPPSCKGLISPGSAIKPTPDRAAKMLPVVEAGIRMKDEHATISNQDRRESTNDRSVQGLVDLTGAGPSEEAQASSTNRNSPLREDSPPSTQFKNPFAGVEALIKVKNSASQPIEISDDEDDEEIISLPKSLPSLDDCAGIARYSATLWSAQGDRDRLLLGQLYALDPRARRRLTKMLASPNITLLWDDLVRVVEAMLTKTEHLEGMHRGVYAAFVNIAWLFSMYVDCQYIASSRLITTEALQKIRSSKHLFIKFIGLISVTLKALHNQSVETMPKDKLLRESLDEKVSSEHSVYDTVPETVAELVVDIMADPVTDTALEAVEGTTLDAALPATSTINNVDDSDEEIIPASRVRTRAPSSSAEGGEEQIGISPRKKKRKLVENVHAKTLREQDHLRLSQQDERRRILRQKLAFSHVDVARDRIIVNEAKNEDEGFVYIDKQIQTQIKKHQVDGVRFMWEQILSQQRQGCLLAHTMGLGKTMQVITLLVAVAEAAQSDDESVVSQIPKSLRTSQTLVLCPPGLIDNWMDELLIWAPGGSLGHLWKIDATMGSTIRFDIISNWFEDGGILILGYEMFRDMVENKATARRASRLQPEDHENLREWLLDGPNIVVADEAHKMKNVRTAVTQAAKQFRTKTRIALTGSPLANNIEEYHTMISWVAPNYLGPIEEFRIKYVEPIQSGLYADSTFDERNLSLKMLGVLKMDLAPKVHRADISVLKDQLKPKKEFVITVALTELQNQAYTLYVQSILSGNGGAKLTKSGEFKQTTVWAWLSVLSLLCNHPECFKDKLEENKDEVGEKKDNVQSALTKCIGAEDEIMDDDATPVSKVRVSQDLIEDEMALFRRYGTALESIEQSNKVSILVQILDESKAAGDKVLVFSQSILTLNYLERLCKRSKRLYARLDGSTQMSKRQGLTKDFNAGKTEIYLISTTAGGLGLNLPGANRVVIFDFKYNPIMEEQAIGRAYRIGQTKPVYVYRFIAGGTFEGNMHNKAVFKTQLASRVVDKKSVVSWAKKKVGEFLFEPKEVVQEDLSEHVGKDTAVLDKILARQRERPIIRAIFMTDTFERHDTNVLTPEDQQEVLRLISEENLKRTNPAAFHAMITQRSNAAIAAGQRPYVAGRDGRSVSEYTPMGMHISRGLTSSTPIPQSAVVAADQANSFRPDRTGPSLPGENLSNLTSVATTSQAPSSTTSRLSTMPELTPVAGANTLIWHPPMAVTNDKSKGAQDTVSPVLESTSTLNSNLQNRASVPHNQTSTPRMQSGNLPLRPPSLPTTSERSRGERDIVADAIKSISNANQSGLNRPSTLRSRPSTPRSPAAVLPTTVPSLPATSESSTGSTNKSIPPLKSTPNAKHSSQNRAPVLRSQTSTPIQNLDVAPTLKPSLPTTSGKSKDGSNNVTPTIESTPSSNHHVQTRASTLRSRSSTPRVQPNIISAPAKLSAVANKGSKDSPKALTPSVKSASNANQSVQDRTSTLRSQPSTPRIQSDVFSTPGHSLLDRTESGVQILEADLSAAREESVDWIRRAIKQGCKVSERLHHDLQERQASVSRSLQHALENLVEHDHVRLISYAKLLARTLRASPELCDQLVLGGKTVAAVTQMLHLTWGATATKDLDQTLPKSGPLDAPPEKTRAIPSADLLSKIGQAPLARFVPTTPNLPKPSSSQIASQNVGRTLPGKPSERENTPLPASKKPKDGASESKTAPTSSATPHAAPDARPWSKILRIGGIFNTKSS